MLKIAMLYPPQLAPLLSLLFSYDLTEGFEVAQYYRVRHLDTEAVNLEGRLRNALMQHYRDPCLGRWRQMRVVLGLVLLLSLSIELSKAS